MKLKELSLNLQVGQKILVGPKNEPAEITKIEFHEKSGEIAINTTKGPRKALTFKLAEDDETDTSATPADKYR
jgi:hypothetical protein